MFLKNTNIYLFYELRITYNKKKILIVLYIYIYRDSIFFYKVIKSEIVCNSCLKMRRSRKTVLCNNGVSRSALLLHSRGFLDCGMVDDNGALRRSRDGIMSAETRRS